MELPCCLNNFALAHAQFKLHVLCVKNYPPFARMKDFKAPLSLNDNQFFI